MYESARDQLAAVSEVVEVARGLGMAVWLRGGWAMDFYLGQITREHADLDWFAWREDLPALVDVLVARGWVEVGRGQVEQQRDLARGGVELAFAGLARAADGAVVVGGGAWAGAAWPAGMLDDAVLGSIGDLRRPVISPEAQVEIKRMMPVWVPALRRRRKDAEDIVRLLEGMQRVARCRLTGG